MSLAALALPLVAACAEPATTGPAPLVLRQDDQAPPGLIFVPGVRATIGADEDHLTELILHEEIYAPSFASEFPQHRMQVADFYLMPTEVTNEQYAHFVRATGQRPPFHWADQDAVDAAQLAFIEEDGRLRQEARERGETPPPAKKFNRKAWWDDNWRDFDWAIPEGREAHPVIYVDYQDARAYAGWAGLRLMTEFEYQAAGRGKEDHPYPWGEEWDDDKVVASANRALPSEQKVGSTGVATGVGLYDLVGNVWEWTSSPFVPFEKYKPFTVKVKSGNRTRDVRAAAEWNADFRVMVGGAWNNPQSICRLTTRRRADRGQQTDAVGFRCAASRGVATDGIVAAVDDLSRGLRPDLDLEPGAAIALDRWETEEGSAKVDGYSVITGYDLVSLIPVEAVAHGNPSSFGIQTLEEGPVGVAVLTTTIPIVEPALEPGSYLLSFRGKGKDRRDEEEAPEGEEPAEGIAAQDDGEEADAPFDINTANLLITDASGELLYAMPIDDVEYASIDKQAPDGKLTVVPYVEPKRPTEGELVADTIEVTLDISSRNKKKAMRFEFPLKVERGAIDKSWRSR